MNIFYLTAAFIVCCQINVLSAMHNLQPNEIEHRIRHYEQFLQTVIPLARQNAHPQLFNRVRNTQHALNTDINENFFQAQAYPQQWLRLGLLVGQFRSLMQDMAHQLGYLQQP